MSYVLRRLELSDLDAVEPIERRSYATPWSRGMFTSELSKPTSRSLAAVDSESGAIVGYLILSRYVDDWHVMNLAVVPEHRRRGVASALLEGLFAETATEAGHGYTLEVRVSNGGAIALYERFGFTSSGLRRAYYTDNREDAIIMWRPAPPAEMPA